MINILTDKDADESVLNGKTIAIIGYGSQGNAQANMLKDSGIKIIIGETESLGGKPNPSWSKAKDDGFEVMSISEAAEKADIVHILLPDEFQADVYKSQIKKYMKFGTLPFTIQSENEALSNEYIGQMIDKIISFDLPLLGRFEVETISKVERILYLISDSISVSLTHLSCAVEMRKETLSSVLMALCKAGVLIRVAPHGSHYSQVRKPSKYLFATPAFRSFFLNSLDSSKLLDDYQGSLFEDLAVLCFQRFIPKYGDFSLSYDSSDGGADFILGFPRKKIAIEVAAGNKGIKQALFTMDKKKCDYGVIFCSEELYFDKEQNIVKVPWQYVLLV